MRFGSLVRITAVFLFGLVCYYLGWRRGMEIKESGATLAIPLVRAQADGVLTPRPLGLPIAGLRLAEIRDTFNEGRAQGKPHEAIDILAPRGTPVLAMVDGTIQKLFSSVPGGLTIYEFDAAQYYSYYYAHLDHYGEGLREGAHVKQGQVIGYVGVTGNAPANSPHLHLAIFELGPEKRWWEGRPINPYPILRKLAGG
jgi:murein DD-endopeptidase MepM/ murein hydrolase activator NlpD